jgi:glycolate oxidase FAD binding subunit
LEAIAPLRAATAADAVDSVTPACIVAPENDAQVSAILAWANVRDVRVIARGGGSKIGWGNIGRGVDLVLSLEHFQGVNEHAWQDMTVTVQAGVSIASLQNELAKHGQRLPLDVLWPDRSTVGGVIATNDSGSLRLRFGSVRDLILGATVVLANGTIARSGGRVVKNVAGYDLPKLFTGSFGTLGVITEVTLRTYPLPHAVRTISFQFADVVTANKYMLAIADTTLVPTGMQMRFGSNTSPVVDLRFEGLEAGIAAQVQSATELDPTGTTDSTEGVWSNREALWAHGDNAVVCKFSVLPSSIAACAEAISSNFPQSEICAQSLGLGIFCAEAASPEQLLNSLTSLRASIAKLGGTLVVLHAPLEMKKKIDVFGELTSAYPLMVRIKQHFDPKGTLSPGRFVGGI